MNVDEKLLIFEPTPFITGQMCVYKQAYVRIIACVCVCIWDYKADLAMIILAADDVSAWRGDMYRVQDWPQHLTKWPERERESMKLPVCENCENNRSYINFQHWKCDSWKWENFTVIQSQMGESHKNMAKVTFHYKIKRKKNAWKKWSLFTGPLNGYYTQN